MESDAVAAVSTAADYLRFTEMLRHSGRLGGADVLGRGTMALMAADHLPPVLQQHGRRQDGPRCHRLRLWTRFSVQRQNGVAAMAGSASDHYWSGVYGTYFWIDPKEG